MFKRCLSALLIFSMLLSFQVAASAAYEELTFTDECVGFLKDTEGFSAYVYSDGSYYYIGYGTRCSAGGYPSGITEEAAEALLREELEVCAGLVNSFLETHDVAATQNQFDAMCCLTYNMGEVWLDKSYTLPGIIIDGVENYTGAAIASAFAIWCHIGDKVSEPLIQNRIREARMFLYGEYGDDEGSESPDFVYVVFNANGGEMKNDVYCYVQDEEFGSFPQATRSGYTFAGWSISGGRLLDAQDTATENLNVTARWTGTAEPEGSTLFPDVSENDWFYPYISTLVGQGVINGFSDGYFYPYQGLTYGQALKLILLASGFTEKTPAQGAHWAQGYLNYAIEKGFVNEGAISNLDAQINRSEIAAIAAAALSLSAEERSGVFGDTIDANVIALYEAGIVEGSFDTNGQRLYKGGDSITRGEISAVISRVAEYVDKNFILFMGYRIRIDDTLTRHSHDDSLFYPDNSGRVQYSGNMKTLTGIDVSYYQGKIDWNAVAADGIDFAFIRAGYRGYISGTLVEDECFKANIKGALAAGIEVGVYFFSQAITREEAVEEAEYVLELLSGYDITWPVVFDWETVSSADARTAGLSVETLTNCAIAFCETIEDAGYTPIVYFNKAIGYLRYDLKKIDGYDKWFAQYNDFPDYIYDYQIWQYTDSGSVSGIEGRVDMNIAFKAYA